MPFGFTHKPLVALADSAICSFFREIEVYGAENVPTEGPIIFACTHANMAVDPAVLSNTIPHGHLLHYWVKDSLFKNPAVGWLLRNAGNIAVDRKNKNNQMLFRGTFEALARGESIGVFPEGTSHTEPHLIPLKDGTAWSALEYVRYLQGTEENKGAKSGKKAVVVPVGIAYVDKAKYRSSVVVHYGPPIKMEDYEASFLSSEQGADKLAVKALTKAITFEFRTMTVNAPDWNTSFAAQMARQLLWPKDNLPLGEYVQVSQTLVDIFCTANEKIEALKDLLATYHRLLTSSRLSNSALAELSLPNQLNPKSAVTLPNRFSTLWLLIKDSLNCLVRLPFFIVPMLIHLPVYVVGILGARLAEDELETQAQTKITFGLILSFLTYPVLFFSLYAVLKQWTFGAVIAAVSVWMLGRYHSTLIDENYDAMKKLAAAWRLVIGVWLPRDFEMPLPAFVAQYSSFAPDPPKVAGLAPDTPKEVWKKPKKLSSRVLVRHVLRVRSEAFRELVQVLRELEQGEEVVAQSWLAEEYGGRVLERERERDEVLSGWVQPGGVRDGREVVSFLRARGADLGVQPVETGMKTRTK
ncbi:hypothetical protein L202_07874 [Cryptococcus amylolentus CBS 6039]|uniref:Phospholipid/glycerol acyltransferase domain-containing protein n=2 Tax=Cryptococcus amylolentus TaxID=104669 RepID=A0A1E3HB12_9TREE|nr:hypothetical protein L202_07874 [Cryptococcus amylolentus CBS 6039]ODN73335.1 hypothetical protein L202_07874 [Cryptococcus amylolentus CBS 6039]ODN99128.1 hypothetical protein I350_07283 [Cryptococcus amylolentus CBS 6273]